MRMLIQVGVLCLLISPLHAATTYYVDANGTNPTSRYSSWATAATNIQDAVNLAFPGDLVLVTNGVYQYGSLSSSRVYISGPTVMSVNGPAVTVIQGYQVPGTTNGSSAIRCVFLKAGTLSGFTLTNGATASGGGYGGGVDCASTACVVSNCVIIGNAAALGGGAYSGTLVNCQILNNAAFSLGWGGGAYSSALINCVVARNWSDYRGGAADNCTLNSCTVVSNVGQTTSLEGCKLTNSISYYNSPDNGQYVYDNCCTFPAPMTYVARNLVTNPPAFVNLAGGDYHLSPVSPCINAGTNRYVTWSTDLDGNPRIQYGTVDIGAYESPYNVRVHYVSMASTNPVTPFNDWSIAATNIQDAVDAATNGDLVLVTNGLYAAGGRRLNNYDVTNRVIVTNALILQSINGPAVTSIVGCQVSDAQKLTNAVRCVLLGNGVVLSGFTLTNGQAGIGNDVNGGGADCGSTAVISNCVLTGNFCAGGGGGSAGGILIGCALIHNQAGGGGGALNATLVNCTVTNNSAGWAAGVLGCKATNCLFAMNSATNYGGGTAFSTLVNCTVAANSLQAGYGGNGGGSYEDNLLNCVVYGNTAPNGSNYFSSSLACCCAAPLAAGTGNLVIPPGFVNAAAGDFHLQTNSPCINSGKNTYVFVTNDLDGNLRIVDGTVDIGAYEYQMPVSQISYAWLQQYGLPIVAGIDATDSDGTGMNNWQKWIAGLNPTNPASVLALNAPTNSLSGVVVSWQSVNTRTYYLQRGTNLTVAPMFSSIQSNIVGQAGVTSFTDTSATNGMSYYYRVGVQ